MPRRSQLTLARWGLFVFSVLVHWGAFRSLPRAVPNVAPALPQAIEFEMLAFSAPPASEPVASLAVPEPSAPGESPRPARRRQRAVSAPVVEPMPPSAASVDALPSMAASASVTSVERPPPAATDDRPSVAAPSPANVSPRAIAVAALAAALNGVPGTELTADLNAVARAKPFGKRPAPQLRKDRDGTCHYAGDAIDATILPDGGVQFDDKPARWDPQWGFAEPPAKPTQFEDRLAPPGVQFSMKHSPRAWEAERAWFLRETEDVRRALADQTRDRELGRSAEQLRRRLESIWCDEDKSVQERRREVFALWDGTSPDEVGERARHLVVEYVRRHAPSGTELAYTEAELLALNAKREQRASFEPYGSP